MYFSFFSFFLSTFMSKIILGINVTSFEKNSGDVQQILSEYGCSIRTRIGLHDVAEGLCAPNGLILIEFIGGSEKAVEMTQKLTVVPGIEVKQMVF